MIRKNIALWLTAAAVVAFAQSTSAIVRVAPRWNFTEIYVQGGSPLGSYNGFPTQDFLLEGDPGLGEFDGSDLYKTGLSLGLSIGQLQQGRFLYSVGFRYTNSEFTDRTLTYTRGIESWLYTFGDVTLRQYDIDLNFNVFLWPLTNSSFAPYAGVGVSAGFTQADWDFGQDENSANASLNLNFGAELLLNKSNDTRSFFALASNNAWNIVASDDRPRYLFFGGSLKYYFKGY